MCVHVCVRVPQDFLLVCATWLPGECKCCYATICGHNCGGGWGRRGIEYAGNRQSFVCAAAFEHLSERISIFVCVQRVQESSLLVLQASLKGELEGNQQQLESSKVTEHTS